MPIPIILNPAVLATEIGRHENRTHARNLKQFIVKFGIVTIPPPSLSAFARAVLALHVNQGGIFSPEAQALGTMLSACIVRSSKDRSLASLPETTPHTPLVKSATACPPALSDQLVEIGIDAELMAPEALMVMEAADFEAVKPHLTDFKVISSRTEEVSDIESLPLTIASAVCDEAELTQSLSSMDRVNAFLTTSIEYLVRGQDTLVISDRYLAADVFDAETGQATERIRLLRALLGAIGNASLRLDRKIDVAVHTLDFFGGEVRNTTVVHGSQSANEATANALVNAIAPWFDEAPEFEGIRGVTIFVSSQRSHVHHDRYIRGPRSAFELGRGLASLSPHDESGAHLVSSQDRIRDYGASEQALARAVEGGDVTVRRYPG